MEIGGRFEPGTGAKGLLTVDGVAGVRTCEEDAVLREGKGPPVVGATAYGCMANGSDLAA